jgi:tRNA(Met) C34 N-acetyltransferase TmcA
MRWRQILQIKPAVQPPAALPTAYYTLDILAVSSDYQGQGIGRLLLEHIHARCEQDEQAAGIYTFTGDEKNTHIYRHFGYEVIEVKQGGPLTVWHMFRPHPARDAETFFAALREATPEQSPARGQKLALSLLGVAGTLIGLALLWRWLRSRDWYFVAQTGSCKGRKSI